jgi:hypothetical protein
MSEREYELQGAIPKSLPRVSSSGPLSTSKKRYTRSVPILRNESSGPELVKHQQAVSTTGKFGQKDIGAVGSRTHLHTVFTSVASVIFRFIVFCNYVNILNDQKHKTTYIEG